MGIGTIDPALQVARPGSDAGDGSDPLLAWRVWRVGFRRTGIRKAEPFLRAITDDEAWTPREPKRATCRVYTHTAPAKECRCGVYGMAEPAPPPYGLPSAGFIAVGRVALWGAIEADADRYRATLGYPQRIGFFCTRCLEDRRAVPAVVVVADSPYGPLCYRHRGLRGRDVAPILQELLDRYAIDLQPTEPLARAISTARLPQMDASYWRTVVQNG